MSIEFNAPYTCDLTTEEGLKVHLDHATMFLIYRQYMHDSMREEIENEMDNFTDKYGEEIRDHEEEIMNAYVELINDDRPRTEETLYAAVEQVYEDYQ